MAKSLEFGSLQLALSFITCPYPIFIPLPCELGVNANRASKGSHLVSKSPSLVSTDNPSLTQFVDQ